MSFKIGDKVRITYNEPTVNEKNGGLGMEGEIVDTFEQDGLVENYRIESKSFVSGPWWFDSGGVELITEPLAPTTASSNTCPRCSNKMVLKGSMMLMGDKFDILKCENCGYCM